MAKVTPPTPMPMAAASPSRRDCAIEIRATKTKLGPGLTVPMASTPMIAENGRRSVISGSEKRIAAIDDEAIAGVIGRGVAHEIDGDAAEIRGLAEAAHRDARHDRVDEFVVRHDAARHVALDPARQDRIGGD